MRFSIALLGVVVFADMLGSSFGGTRVVSPTSNDEGSLLAAEEMCTITAFPKTSDPMKTIDGASDTFWQCGPVGEGNRRFLGSKDDSSEDGEDGRKRGPKKRNRRKGRGPREDPRCSIQYHFYNDQYIERIGIEFENHGDGSTHNPNFKIKVVKNMERSEYMLIAAKTIHDGLEIFDLQRLAHRPPWTYLSLELLGLDDDDYVGIRKVVFFEGDDYSDDSSDSDDHPVRDGGKGKHRKKGKGGDKKNSDDESRDGKRPKKGGKRKDSEEVEKKGRKPKDSRDKNDKKDDKKNESRDGKRPKKGGKKGRKPKDSPIKNGKKDDKKDESRDGKLDKKGGKRNDSGEGGKKARKPKKSRVKNGKKDDKKDEKKGTEKGGKGQPSKIKSKRGKSKGSKRNRKGKPEK